MHTLWKNSYSFSRDFAHGTRWTSPPFYKFVSIINDFTLFMDHNGFLHIDLIFQRKLLRGRLQITFVNFVSHASAKALRPITFTRRFRATRRPFLAKNKRKLFSTGYICFVLSLFYKSNKPHFLSIYQHDAPLGTLGKHSKICQSQVGGEWFTKFKKR